MKDFLQILAEQDKPEWKERFAGSAVNDDKSNIGHTDTMLENGVMVR